MGYWRAGFDVVGVDIDPQPNYPFQFFRGDALSVKNWERFSAVHASPPCQLYSKSNWRKRQFPDLVSETRRLLIGSELPYVIENVEGAPLITPWMLCGSMFGLGAGGYEIRRHRLFEANWEIGKTPEDICGERTALSVYGHGGKVDIGGKSCYVPSNIVQSAMGIDWVPGTKIGQMIPPSYTEWIGRRLRKSLSGR